MIYELRTYTVKAGTAGEAAKTAGTIGRDIRGDNFGKLEGYWMTEIGPLNQVMHLWSYPDFNERIRLRGELSKNKRWTSEYVPLIREKLVRQDIRLLNGIIAPSKPAKEGNIYELRNYRCKAGGGVGQWITHFREALPVREKHSKICALFQTEAGQPNEVCHLWAYPDLNARAAVRAAADADPGWQAFLPKIRPLLEEMHSTILLPAAHSPLK
jgi:NIPSNAP